jgi:nicotinamide-nucleotide adenylyltransferase
MKRALFLGRFQPYHKGHHSIVERMSREADEIIIAIGSAQWSHDNKDPFTAGERIMMITRALESLPVTKYVLPIEDIQRNSLYVSHIVSLTPLFDVVYSNNPLVKELFETASFAIQSTPLEARHQFWGTQIRRQMLEGEGWREMVPEGVAEIIDEIDGVERYRRIHREDTAASVKMEKL